MNTYIESTNGYLNIKQLGDYANVTIDYALEDNFFLTDTYIGASINGTIFDFGNYSIP